MIERRITLDGASWKVSLAGRFTTYERDEFPLVFERAAEGGGGKVERRATRFSPRGAKSRDEALAELSDAELAALFRSSQPDWTSPELNYARS
ncbi:MAG TPA: hypothetical protein VMT21_00685 [Gemmatimonadales bacterium]|nr:hypothetical protein [Gemmatimonadales bacterium]